MGVHSISGQRRLKFLQVLGRGGFGAVFLADLHGHDGFVQRVAVKVLNIQMSHSADIAARQRDEARLLARLNHDQIVKVFDLTEVHGRPAVVMEYVEGVDLGQLVREGPLPTKVALQTISQAASALHAAWESTDPQSGRPMRVVHRDIKPSNLLLSRHGGLKVLDFGIARGDFEREGATGSVQFGTSRFMAPEQWLYQAVSNKVDIYALGVTMVDLLAGAALERAPLDPARFRVHIDAAVKAIVHSGLPSSVQQGLGHLATEMLEFDPTDRPPAGAVHERALALADELPGEGLGRFARRVVPPILARRTASVETDPLIAARPTINPSIPAPQPATTQGPAAALQAVTPTSKLPSTVPFPGPTDPRLTRQPRGPHRRTSHPDTPTLIRPAAPSVYRRPLWHWPFGGTVIGLVAVAIGLWSSTLLSEGGPTETAAGPAVIRSAPPTPDARTPLAPDEASTDSVSPLQPHSPEALPLPHARPSTNAPVRTVPPEPSEPGPKPPPPSTAEPQTPPTAPTETNSEPSIDAPPEETPALSKQITLTSSPIGAAVTVNGRLLDGSTPIRISLPHGKHPIVIQKAGRSCSGSISVGPLSGKTVLCDLAVQSLQTIR